ncbi:MAG: Kelch repeat-containing protein [Saprospiraceae bacterium]
MRKSLYNVSLFLLPLIFLLMSCNNKEYDRVNFLDIKTNLATEVTLVSATLSGEITGIKVDALTQHGFVWSKSKTDPSFAINDGKILLGAKEVDGVFTSELIMLEKNETYYVRSFAIAEEDVEIYGETISFITNDIRLTTDSITYVRGRVATIHGSFYGIESSVELNELGVVWSKINANPVINGDSPDSYVTLREDLADGSFSAAINNLQDSATYYYRTFASLNFGNQIIYGETKTWETNLNDVWHQKRTMIEATKTGLGFGIGDFGYCLYENKIFRYDPENDLWETRQQNSGPTLDKGGYFAIGNNLYVTCGTNSTEAASKKMYKYNVLADEWTAMPDFPGEPRKWVLAFSIGEVGYLGLGQRADESNIKDFWKFEEGVGWTELEITNPDFPGTNHYFLIGGFSDGQRGYIAGDQISANFWVYKPETNTWEERNELPGGKSNGMVGFQINNQLYLGTGASQGQGQTKALWRYNYEDDSWTELADLPGLPRKDAMGFAIGNKGYIGGGFVSWPTKTNEFWEYKILSD